jgi:WD40 repeat protein
MARLSLQEVAIKLSNSGSLRELFQNPCSMGMMILLSIVRYSPDGQNSSDRGSFRWHHLSFWTAGGELIRTIDAHDDEYQFENVSFSPDGQTIASISVAGTTALLWTAQTGKCYTPLKVMMARVVMMRFSPDGQTICLFQWCHIGFGI